MRILLISLLFLTLAGCAHSNFAWHYPALYYNDSKTLADQHLQQSLADPNDQPNRVLFLNGGVNYIYTFLEW